MKILITFGQVHFHIVNGKTFDKDTIAIIDCKDREQGRQIAFELFGDEFFTDYSEDQLDNKPFMGLFPKGAIAVEGERKKGRERLLQALEQRPTAANYIRTSKVWNEHAENHTDPRLILTYAFNWAQSEQGHEYWKEIHENL